MALRIKAAIKEHRDDLFSKGTKLTCLFMLLSQMVGLDFLIIKLDTGATLSSRYAWVGADVVIFIAWTITLLKGFVEERAAKENDEGTLQQENVTRMNDDRGKRAMRLLFRSLSMSAIVWLLYSLVLVAKVLRMFSTFALSLPSGEHVISSTFLNVMLAKTGFILTLLIYSLKSNVKDPETQDLVTDKLCTNATFDVIDSVMLLGMLFSIPNPAVTHTAIYHAIRVFACICLVLPFVPLLAMTLLNESHDRSTFHLVLMVSTLFRMLLGNVPHMVLRLHLWHSHSVDVSTFLVKNLVVLFVGMLDITKHIMKLRKECKISKERHLTDQHSEVELKP